MNADSWAVPLDGICLDGYGNLFIIDVGGLLLIETERQRRVFVDIGAAVEFAGDQDVWLFAFLARPGRSAESAVYGVVEEVFKSTSSDTYLVHFSGAPWAAVKFSSSSSTNSGQYEAFKRIYPAPGADV